MSKLAARRIILEATGTLKDSTRDGVSALARAIRGDLARGEDRFAWITGTDELVSAIEGRVQLAQVLEPLAPPRCDGLRRGAQITRIIDDLGCEGASAGQPRIGREWA